MAEEDYSGKKALVVGATSGIGQGIALALAKKGFTITAVGRSLERGAKVEEDLKSASNNPHKFIPCDASLLSNIEKMTAEYLKDNDSLDILILTQGIATIQGYTPTEENIDLKLVIHYFGRMKFINCLLPALQKSTLEGGGRVLSVLAAGVHDPYMHYEDDPMLKDHYSTGSAANAATMYNDIAMDSFARENPTISFFHVTPGFVNTNWGSEMPWMFKLAIRIVQPMGRSTSQVGDIMSGGILHPPQDKEKTHTDIPNFYLLNQNGKPTTKTTIHDKARECVWQHTNKVLETVKEKGKWED